MKNLEDAIEQYKAPNNDGAPIRIQLIEAEKTYHKILGAMYGGTIIGLPIDILYHKTNIMKSVLEEYGFKTGCAIITIPFLLAGIIGSIVYPILKKKDLEEGNL